MLKWLPCVSPWSWVICLIRSSHRKWPNRRAVCNGRQPPAKWAIAVIRGVHYSDVIMIAIASQITSVSIVNLIVCSGADQRKYQSSASLAFVRGIHRWPGKTPHKGPVKPKCFHLLTSSCDEVLRATRDPSRKGLMRSLSNPCLFCVLDIHPSRSKFCKGHD